MPPSGTDDGLRAVERIRREIPGVAVLILSQHVQVTYTKDIVAAGGGGIGYVLKDRVSDIDRFVAAVRIVAAGGTVFDPEIIALLVARERGRRGPLGGLTDRECEVLALMAEGATNQTIAGRLAIAENTVEKHCNAIFGKLGLDTNPQGHRRVLAVLAYLAAVA
jgi:DNA-binding NarL/FixJ family response regulator